MSRRTFEANKAIATAWVIEQQLASEGKGTRDWTKEQQQCILEKGKAYDDIGKAFEGQHMKSVEMYPEYQGDPENIQFLTKEEHIDAHGGNWKNPTNWYYDPVTKKKTDFGDGPVTPCEVIKLSEPIRISIAAETTQEAEDKGKAESADKKSNMHSDAKESQKPVPHSNGVAASNSSQPKVASKPAEASGIIRLAKRVAKGVGKAVKAAGRFVVDHKEEIIAGGLAIGGAVLIKAVVDSSTSSGGSGSGDSDSYSYNSNNTVSSTDSFIPGNDSITEAKNYPETHASPQEHTVTPHGQHYHTKDGTIWKDKDSFSRGGKKTDEYINLGATLNDKDMIISKSQL